MPWYCLVIHEGSQSEFGHPFRPERNLEDARTRPVEGRRHISRRRIRFTEPRKRLRDDRANWPMIEQCARTALSIAHDGLHVRHDHRAPVFGQRVRLILLELDHPILNRSL